MATTFRQLVRTHPILIIFLVGILLFCFLIALDTRKVGSDDTVFQNQMLPYHTLWEWVAYRYQTWSGRIVGEGVLYAVVKLPLVFWQVASVAFYALATSMLFRFYKVFRGKEPAHIDACIALTALTLPYLLDKSVFAEGILWVTGGTVYFWTYSLLLLALYPVAYLLARDRWPSRLWQAAGALAAVFVILSQEQAAIVYICVVMAVLVREIVSLPARKDRCIVAALSAMLLCGIFILTIGLAAPGNTQRMVAESTHWIPDFYTVPFWQRADWSYRWIIEATVNHSGALLVVVWAGMLVQYHRTIKKTQKLLMPIMLVIGIATTATMFRWLDYIAPWFTFYATWHPLIPSPAWSLTAYPWLIVLIATIIAPLLLWRRQLIGWVISVLLGTFYISTVAMIFSPTMYASSWRSMLIPSGILLVTAFCVICVTLRQLRKINQAEIFIVSILTIAGGHFLFQCARLIHR